MPGLKVFPQDEVIKIIAPCSTLSSVMFLHYSITLGCCSEGSWPHLHNVKGPLLLFNIKPVGWSCRHRCAHLCVPNQQPPHTPLLHSPVPSIFAQGHSAFIQLKPAIPFLWRSASGITGPVGSQNWVGWIATLYDRIGLHMGSFTAVIAASS